MTRKRQSDHTPADSSDARDRGSFVTNRELDARIAEVKNELKWLKYFLGVLAAAVAAPKLGGPDAAKLSAELVRTFLV